MLYKPLIGPKAIDLYLSLYFLSNDYYYNNSDVDSSEDNQYSKNRINSFFLHDIISDYEMQSSKLEDQFAYLKIVQLIDYKCFKANNDGELFWNVMLYPPYSANEFFTVSEMSFAKQFKYRTSDQQVKKIMNKMLGKEIDIPTITDSDELKLSYLTKTAKPNRRKYDTIPFSFENFRNELSNFIEIDINDKEFFEAISYLFGYDSQSMIGLFTACVDVNTDS